MTEAILATKLKLKISFIIDFLLLLSRKIRADSTCSIRQEVSSFFLQSYSAKKR